MHTTSTHHLLNQGSIGRLAQLIQASRLLMLLAGISWFAAFGQTAESPLAPVHQPIRADGSPYYFPTSNNWAKESNTRLPLDIQQEALRTKRADASLYNWIPRSNVVIVPNIGQCRAADGSPATTVRYISYGAKAQYLFTEQGLSYVFYRQQEPGIQALKNGTTIEGLRIDMQVIGGDMSRMTVEQPSESHFNFYLTGRAENQTNIQAYRMVRYSEVYPNIDLVFYGKGGEMKYDWVIRPGGNPQQIQVNYAGAQNLSIGEDGQLLVQTAAGNIIEQPPFSFQSINDQGPGATKPEDGPAIVSTRYRIQGNTVSFDIPRYDTKRLLVIDPTLAWSTYMGGTDEDELTGVVTDGLGNVYFSGWSFSLAFPTTVGSFQPLLGAGADAIVAKFNATTGARIWSTYVGGTAGPSIDAGGGITVDRTGAVIFTGLTNSPDFPVAGGFKMTGAAAGIFDAFVFKLSPAGARVWGSFYGGAAGEGEVPGDMGIAVDDNNDLYITGTTESNGLTGVTPTSYQPNLDGTTDAFVAKLRSDGTAVIWATYFGGGNNEFANSIAVNGAGKIAITGCTNSSSGSFPIEINSKEPHQTDLDGSSDAFVAVFNPDGYLDWGTYFGRDGEENSNPRARGAVTFGPDGHILITGTSTTSAVNLSTPGTFQAVYGGGTQDAFVAKFAAVGGPTALIWCSYLGGNNEDAGLTIKALADGQVVVGGQTFSTNFPTAGLPYQASFGGGSGSDGFLSVISASGATLSNSTFLGGNSTTGFQDDRINSLAVSRDGNIYVGGTTQSTTDFLAAKTFQATNGGDDDAFLARFNYGVTAPCEAVSTGTPLELLVFQYGVDLTEEYPNTMAALDRYFKNYNLTTTDDPLAFPGLLAGKNVVIIPEIEDPTIVLTVFTSLAAPLNTFVNNGGTVIYLGTHDLAGFNLDQCIWNTGLWAGNWTSSSRSGDDVLVGNFDTPLTNGLGRTMRFAPTVSNYSITSPGLTNILTRGGFPHVSYRPIGTGKTILIGADYEAYSDEQARLLANAVSWPGASASGALRLGLAFEKRDASCGGGSDGRIDLTVINALLPVSYAWSNGSTSQDVNNLVAGTYSVTVTAGPCTERLSIVINDCAPCTPPLDININVTPPSQCAPAAAVNLTSTVTGGVCGDYQVAPTAFSPVPVPPTAVTVPLVEERLFGPFPIGFDFDFYCNNFRQFYLSDNGYLTFGPTEELRFNGDYSFGSGRKPSNLIGLPWIDGSPDAGTRVTYFVTGVAPNRRLVVNYESLRYFDQGTPPPPPASTSQLILHEGTGVIDIHITSSPDRAGIPKSLGIENADGSRFTAVTGRNNRDDWAATNEGWRFTPVGSPASLSYEWTIPPSLAVLGTAAAFTHTPSITTTYQVRVANTARNCFTAKTAVAEVVTGGGTVSPASSTVCAGNTSGPLTLVGHTGTILRWESSTTNDCNNFTSPVNVGGAGLTSFTSAALSVSSCFRAVIQNGACAINSNAVRVDVTPSIVPGNVLNSQSICLGNPPVSLNLTGQSGGTIIRWEASTNCATFGSPVDIGNAGNTSFSPPPGLSATTCYRAVLQSGTCTVSSGIATITVDNPTVAGTVASNKTICTGTGGGDLTLSGATGNVVRWEFSTDCGGFTNLQVIPSTANTITLGILTTTTCYRAVVQNGACVQLNTAPVRVTTDALPVGGTITSLLPSVCNGSTSGVLTLAGNTGNVVRWESSTDCPAFTAPVDLGNAGLSTFTSGPLTVPTCFRAIVQNGVCAPVPSAVLTLGIDGPTVAGTIGSASTVCAGDPVPPLTLTGQTGAVVRWESSADCSFAPATDLGNAGIVAFTPGPLAATSCFRAVVQNGGCIAQNTNNITVTVTPGSVGGTLAPAATTVCSGAASGVLTVSGTSGTILRWESSTDCVGFTSLVAIPNTTATYNAPALTQRTCFRAVVQSGSCGLQFSSVASVSVDNPSIGGTVNGANIICVGAPAPTLTLTGATGVVVRWESSTNCPAFTAPVNLGNVGNSTLSPGAVAVNTCYRAVVKNGACPEVNSTIAEVVVSPLTVAGTLNTNRTICAGDNSGLLTLTGQTGSPTQWESSTDCSFANPALTSVIPNNTPNYVSAPLTATTCFRVIVRSGVCAPETTATVQITVVPASFGGNLAGGRSVCAGETSGLLRLIGQSGNILRWEASTDCIGFTNPVDLGNGGFSQYTSGRLTRTTCFRVAVQSGICPIVFSSIARVNVTDLRVNATGVDIGGCAANGRINVFGSGGSGRYIYSIDPPRLAANRTGTFDPLGEGTYRVLVFDSQTGCTRDTTITIGRTGVLPTITDIPLSGVSTSSAVLRWNPIPGTDVTYEVRYRVLGSTNWIIRSAIPTNAVNLVGLQNNTRYEVSVRFRCGAGGSASPWVPETTFATLPSGDCFTIPPAEPGGVFVRSIAPREMTIQWNEVPFAEGYLINFGIATLPVTSWPSRVVCAPNNTLRIPGLVPGQSYGFRIRTHCESCTSPIIPRQVSRWTTTFTARTPFLREGIGENDALNEENLTGENGATDVLGAVSIYPNPNNGFFQINFSSAIDMNGKVRIFASSSSLIHDAPIDAKQGENVFEFDISSYASGIYFIEIMLGEHRVTEKIVKH
jgi:hypothetical protein